MNCITVRNWFEVLPQRKTLENVNIGKKILWIFSLQFWVTNIYLMVRRHLPLGIFIYNCYRVINIILSFWGFYQCEAKFVLNSKIFSQRALAVSGIHHCRSWPKNFCSKKEKRTFYSWMSCESNFQKKNKEEKKKNSVWSISHKMWCHRPFIKSKCSKTAQQKVSYYRNYTLNTPSLIYFGELKYR